MKKIFVLFLLVLGVQGVKAQLFSLGLVEESNIEKEIPNGIKRGYFYFIPEIKFIGDNLLYVGTPNGLYKCDISVPTSVEWEKLPITDDIIEDFEVRGDTIIVLSRKELLLSIDGGMTVLGRFSDTIFLDTIDYVVRELHNIAVCPNDARKIYVAHEIGYLSYTDDFGLNWSRVSDTGLADLYYSPHNPDHLVGYNNSKVTDATGAYVSTDGGLNWEYARRISGTIGETYRIAFHPANADRLVACGNGVYALSDDGGTSWNRIYLEGYEQYQTPAANIFDVVYDKRNPDILYGASQYSFLYREDIDTMKVVRSTDGGSTWSEFFAEPMNNQGHLLRMDIKDNILALYTSANGIYLLDVDVVTTSVSGIEKDVLDTPYYDLQGRPVTNPARGIYIKDGRKIAVD